MYGDCLAEASHVNVNIPDDTCSADPKGWAVGALINLGLPQLTKALNQQARLNIHSLPVGVLASIQKPARHLLP